MPATVPHACVAARGAASPSSTHRHALGMCKRCLDHGPLIPVLPFPNVASPSGPSGLELGIWVPSWPVPITILGRRFHRLTKIRLGTGQLGTQTPSSGPDGPLGEAKLGRGEPELRGNEVIVLQKSVANVCTTMLKHAGRQ